MKQIYNYPWNYQNIDYEHILNMCFQQKEKLFDLQGKEQGFFLLN